MLRVIRIFVLIFSVVSFHGYTYSQDSDTLSPSIVKGPEVSDVTDTSATISWETDEPAIGKVEYGSDSTLADSVILEELKEEQEVTITGLSPATTYLFRVGATDSAGNGPTYSDIANFTTEETPSFSGSVEIITEEIELVVGDSVQLVAAYTDTTGEEIDTTFDWSVVPDSLGHFNATGLFSATHVGEGYVFARLGDLVDSTSVRVEAEEGGEGKPGEGQLVIVPGDTIVDVGTTLQYSAFYQDTLGVLIDTMAEWSIHGDPIGTISTEGLLTVLSPGVGLVKGKLDNWERTSTVAAVDTTTDTTGVNVINISRVLPSGRVLPPQTLNEGQVYVIGGLPYPLNLLNDGWLYFPTGSLREDITIHIKLPEFANVGDTVTFGEGIINGADFDVFVSGTLVEPYFFELPLNVAIPFKRGLINSLGIKPGDLGLFFALDSTTFDTSGIYNVTVDSVANRIFSQVAHFSTLVVAEKTVISVSVQDRATEAVPERFDLMQNYPNPFNAVTTLRYSLPRRSEVELTIYDILGREIRSLVRNVEEAGLKTVTWDGTNNLGEPVSTGVYLYQIQAGSFTQTRKMILLR